MGKSWGSLWGGKLVPTQRLAPPGSGRLLPRKSVPGTCVEERVEGVAEATSEVPREKLGTAHAEARTSERGRLILQGDPFSYLVPVTEPTAGPGAVRGSRLHLTSFHDSLSLGLTQSMASGSE
jgi:hypothetical protein